MLDCFTLLKVLQCQYDQSVVRTHNALHVGCFTSGADSFWSEMEETPRGLYRGALKAAG